MAEHRQEFERELEGIETKIIELFAMIAEDLPTATQALLSSNNEAVQMLAERDRVIDGLYAEIEELVNRQILLQAPDGWCRRDGSDAFVLAGRDSEMDDLGASVIGELAAGRMAVPVTMEMT